MSDYQNGNGGARAPRVTNGFDNKGIRISGFNEDKKRCFLQTAFGTDNRVSLTLWTNIDGDKDGGRLSGKFEDLVGWSSFLVAFENVVNFVPTAETPSISDKAMLMRPNFKGQGQRPEGYVPAAECLFGKDKEGRIWICVTAYNRPKIKFVFDKGDYYNFVHGTGENFSVADVSKLWAQGWLNLIRGMTATAAIVHWKEPEKKQGGNGGGGNRGGGGYNNRGGNGGGGYDRRSNGGGGEAGGGSSAGAASDFSDDDMPF